MTRRFQLVLFLTIGLALPGCIEKDCTCVEDATDQSGSAPADAAASQLEFNYQAARELQLLGELNASKLFIERVIHEDPAYKDTHFMRGFAFQQTGAPAEAIRSYRRHLELDPAHVQARFNLAYAQMTTRDYEGAIKSFHRALELQPKYSEIHVHLATCFDALGQPDKAEMHRKLQGP